MSRSTLPANTTVLSIAPAHSGVWLATDAGVWHGVWGAWQLLATQPTLQLATVIVQPISDEQNAPLLVGGLPSGIQFSVDQGTHWFSAWIDEVASGITCFTCSPRFAHDRVLLAGTERDGILRSTDGGRRWRLANFGLAGFTILALAAAPDWNEREVVFAATDEGVYRSPNGGRAWKRTDTGIEGVAVQTLAISPQFAHERTLYAGSEGDLLYHSIDAGRSWHKLAASPPNVNCIWIDPTESAHMVVGTSEGTISYSHDRGSSWTNVTAGTDALLALTASEGILYAGLYEGGLLVSQDKGRSWEGGDR